MSEIDDVLRYYRNYALNQNISLDTVDAAIKSIAALRAQSAELALLRAAAAEAQAAHVYLDESPVNDPNDDTPHTLAERIAAVVNDNAQQAARIAELEAAVSEARVLLHRYDIGVKYFNDCDCKICQELKVWLAAHPAPAQKRG